ncbi:MAG: phosphotransacetylase family protein [Spirulina sp. SIO3F2]|nr:phosphotransacetylase family protein [Spirulina sp. SIO3F2]
MAGAKYLLVGSTEAYSGKSAAILGIADQLKRQGITIGYGKPLTIEQDHCPVNAEADVSFIIQSLALPETEIKPPLLCLDPDSLVGYLQADPSAPPPHSALRDYLQDVPGDLVLLEGPATLSEGSLVNLSLAQMSAQIDAPILLVARYHAIELIDQLLDAKQRLGDRLIGVLVNDVPEAELVQVKQTLEPFLEAHTVPLLGLLPRDSLLRSVSVRELATQLDAKVLCRADRLDLMVESLTIGAMNVNSALEYFRKGRNMAVVTGGDRTELQLAALETSTNCLILTGHSAPQDFILSRAEDLEIPILSVDLDTLTTVEIADQAFGQVRLQEPIKVQCIQALMQAHFDTSRLIKTLGLETSPV